MQYERDLVQSGFEIVLSNYSSKTIMIPFRFSLTNLSSDKEYSLHYSICALKIDGSTVGKFIIEPHPQSWARVGEPKIPKGQHGGATGDINIGPSDTKDFEALQKIDGEFLEVVNNKFSSEPPGRRDVNFEVELLVYASQYQKKNDIFEAKGNVATKFEFPYKIDESKWLQWIRSIGYRTTIISIPEEVVANIRSVMREKGFLTEWEVVSRALTSFEGITKDITLIRGTASSQNLKNIISGMIKNAKRNIYIAVQFVDTSLSQELKAAVGNRNVGLKLVILPPKDKLFNVRNPKETALRELIKIATIKTYRELHCRMIIVDDEVVVGSMDLDEQGLTVHDNLAIKTNDPTVLQSAKKEFDDIFGRGQPYALPQ